MQSATKQTKKIYIYCLNSIVSHIYTFTLSVSDVSEIIKFHAKKLVKPRLNFSTRNMLTFIISNTVNTIRVSFFDVLISNGGDEFSGIRTIYFFLVVVIASFDIYQDELLHLMKTYQRIKNTIQ